MMIIMAASNLAGGTVRDEGSEADDLSIEDGDAVELLSQDRNLPRLLWRPSPTTPHHIRPYLSPLHISHDGSWQKIVESLFGFHLFCIKLSNLLHDLLGKNLHNQFVCRVTPLTELTPITEWAFLTKK